MQSARQVAPPVTVLLISVSWAVVSYLIDCSALLQRGFIRHDVQEKLLQRASEVCNLQQAMEALAIERDCLQDKLKVRYAAVTTSILLLQQLCSCKESWQPVDCRLLLLCLVGVQT